MVKNAYIKSYGYFKLFSKKNFRHEGRNVEEEESDHHSDDTDDDTMEVEVEKIRPVLDIRDIRRGI